MKRQQIAQAGEDNEPEMSCDPSNLLRFNVLLNLSMPAIVEAPLEAVDTYLGDCGVCVNFLAVRMCAGEGPRRGQKSCVLPPRR